MNSEKIIDLLKYPQTADHIDTTELQSIIDNYPYFQGIKAVQLKALKNNNSLHYNQKLKETAAYTTDRAVLFRFITSKNFNNSNKATTPIEVAVRQDQHIDESPSCLISKSIKEVAVASDEHPANLEVSDPSTSNKIINPNTPLEFTSTETHSFSEWLKLTRAQPIARVTEKKENSNKKKLIESPLIDRFLKNNPKIKPVKKSAPAINLAASEIKQPEDLMTETLAKVYIAQKNYKKAIQAYKILSLKNPEKSGLFADQIRAIKKLQDNNK